jgi:hypothetical protein
MNCVDIFRPQKLNYEKNEASTQYTTDDFAMKIGGWSLYETLKKVNFLKLLFISEQPCLFNVLYKILSRGNIEKSSVYNRSPFSYILKMVV